MFRSLEDYIFQHDATPTHYSNQVITCLKRKRPNGKNRRDSPLSWPAHYPGQTSCKFIYVDTSNQIHISQQ